MRSSGWPERALGAVVACSLEAGWITLAYITAEGVWANAFSPLTLLGFAISALLGLSVARWSARAASRAYRPLVAGLALALALIGWLWPLGFPVDVVLEQPLGVLGAHPGGLLLGVAFLRGVAHASTGDEERIADTALRVGLVVVAVCWVLLTASGLTHEPSVVAPAFAATVTFVTAGLLAIGLARLADLRRAGVVGADRRTWVAVLLGVVATLLAVSVPLAAALGVPLDTAVRGVLGPVDEVLVLAVTLLLWPVALLVGALTTAFAFLAGLIGDGTGHPSRGISVAVGDWLDGLVPDGSRGLPLGALPVVLAVVAAFLLLRILLRRPRLATIDGDVVEERESEPGSGGLRVRRPQISPPRRRRVPRTASEAYLASLELLVARPEAARIPSETPAEHARRLGADSTGPAMRRLAADFALVEFGGRTLSTAEHRRAIERWRRLLVR